MGEYLLTISDDAYEFCDTFTFETRSVLYFYIEGIMDIWFHPGQREFARYDCPCHYAPQTESFLQLSVFKVF